MSQETQKVATKRRPGKDKRDPRDLMPLNQIRNKPFYRIPLSEINPYSDMELVRTVYVLGSPGSGKSRLLLRLQEETKGKLAIESGVFDLFQRCVSRYVRKKRADGITDSIGFHSLDFDMPNIDGLSVFDNYQDGLEKDVRVNNASYSGMGSYHYREFLPGVSSGGKSGFPDWLFIPASASRYVQVISFPGHRNIEIALENRSIPKIPPPDCAIYLVDPDINFYYHEDFSAGEENPPLNLCDKHLSDILRLEDQGIETHWFLSKTLLSQLEQNKRYAIETYSCKPALCEMIRRIPELEGFDSFGSGRDELYNRLGRPVGIF